MTERVHATAVSLGGHGILLIGASGSGKSDLALRLIDRGARLIGDDSIVVDPADPLPLLYGAANIAGQIEVRGVGILRLDHVDAIPLRLAVTLDQPPERMPPDGRTISIAGFDIPWIVLSALEASTPVKIEYALKSLVDGGVVPVASTILRP